jgi:hypothetical protein
LRQTKRATKASLPPSAAYLADAQTLLASTCDVAEPKDWLRMDIQDNVLARRAARLVFELAMALTKDKKPWHETQIQSWRVSVAHGQLLQASALRRRVMHIQQVHPELYPVMKQISDLVSNNTTECNTLH